MPHKYISGNLRAAFALTGILWISAYSAGTLPLWKAHVPGIRAGTIAAGGCQQLALMLADKLGSDVLMHERGRLMPVWCGSAISAHQAGSRAGECAGRN